MPKKKQQLNPLQNNSFSEQETVTQAARQKPLIPHYKHFPIAGT